MSVPAKKNWKLFGSCGMLNLGQTPVLKKTTGGMRFMRKQLSIVLALSALLTLPVSAAEPDAPLTGGVSEIQKYGNLVLDITPDALDDAGYTYGDLMTVTVDGTAYEMPLCTNYSDVDTGKLVLRDDGTSVIVAVNMGDFATTNGIAEKTTTSDGAFSWTVSDGRTLDDLSVSIALKEAGGYRDEYLIHQLVRTNDRADYASDQVFANFRNIPFGSLGKNALFRSSSPVNNEIGRAAYADRFAQENHIQTVLNLANSTEEIDSYLAADDFNSPYYQSLYQAGQVKALGLGVDFTAADFQSGLADGLRFLTTHEGPYLVHCNEGKDRAGFVSALLSCYMGASYEQVVSDYMVTYENYYHLTPDSEQYNAVKNSNIVSILSSITGISDRAALPTVNLADAAAAYLKKIGLTDAECAALRANLSKDYTAESAAPVEKPAETPAEPPVKTPTAPVEVPIQTPTTKPVELPTADTSDSLYTVVSGDCLWNISYQVYGTGTQWMKIYEANKTAIPDPEMIYVGQVLTIPAA